MRCFDYAMPAHLRFFSTIVKHDGRNCNGRSMEKAGFKDSFGYSAMTVTIVNENNTRIGISIRRNSIISNPSYFGYLIKLKYTKQFEWILVD